MEKPAPKKLKLVRLNGPLGDLSGMTAAERAEIVQQDGRRRIYEEIVRAEMEAWRKFFLWGGMCAGGWTAVIVIGLGMELLRTKLAGLPDPLWALLGLISAVGGLLGLVAFWPAVFLFVKLLGAMRRRRRASRA